MNKEGRDTLFQYLSLLCRHYRFFFLFYFFFLPQPGGPAFQGGGADLGILKSLSSMSVVARRNLNNLALQFSKHTQGQGEGGSLEERDRLVQDEGVICLIFIFLLLLF